MMAIGVEEKLFFVSGGAGAACIGPGLGAKNKSFLVLFFKKKLS
jgi:hypothetical protein